MKSSESPRVEYWAPAEADQPPRPLIKMPGSKRWILPALQQGVLAHLTKTGGRFFEPFAGSGAVSLGLGARGAQIVLGDACRDLALLLVATRDSPGDLYTMMQRMIEQGVDEGRYLWLRRWEPAHPVDRAARTLYMLRLSFNGLWRVNSGGQFNVPYGRGTTRSFPSEAAFMQVHNALKGAEIYHADFRTLLGVVRAGDVVYADPPYVGTFDGYSAKRFGLEDATALAKTLQDLAAAGASVIVSSPSTPEIAGAYESWAYSATVPRPHKVAARAKDRKVYQEAIYSNAPNLVDLTAVSNHLTLEVTVPTLDDEFAEDEGGHDGEAEYGTAG